MQPGRPGQEARVSLAYKGLAGGYTDRRRGTTQTADATAFLERDQFSS